MSARRMIPIALLPAVLLGGCFTATPRLDGFVDRLEQQMPGTRFEPEMGLRFGRLSLGLARGIAAAMDDEDDDALRVVAGLRRVEIGSYRARGPRPDAALADSLHGSLERAGWQTIARMRDEDELVWVLCRVADGEITGFLVAALEDRELHLVRLQGRLSRSFAAAFSLAQDHS